MRYFVYTLVGISSILSFAFISKPYAFTTGMTYLDFHKIHKQLWIHEQSYPNFNLQSVTCIYINGIEFDTNFYPIMKNGIVEQYGLSVEHTNLRSTGFIKQFESTLKRKYGFYSIKMGKSQKYSIRASCIEYEDYAETTIIYLK